MSPASPIHYRKWNVVAFLIATAGMGETASSIRAGPNNRFYDGTGRVAVFRGFNVVGRAKTPPFTPFTDLSTLDSIASLGVNVARVPFNWEAFEPSRGSYNSTYLKYYQGVVEHLFKMGIVSIVDVHQDGLSRYLNYGCGDGFPLWIIPARYLNQLSTPDNDVRCKNWKYTLLLDPAVAGTWLAFFNNENDVRDAFLKVWDILAGAFSGNPAVLGYDIINEPAGQQRNQIQALWEDAAKVIRKRDPDAILFLTPQFLLGVGGTPNFKQPTFNNYAIGVHWYPFLDFPYFPNTEEQFHTWFEFVYPWGAPILVGEFGLEPDCPESGKKTTAMLMDEFYNFFDLHFLSWTQWAWFNAWDNKTFDGWNLENFSIVDIFKNVRPNYAIRPYPRAIAGIPISFAVSQKSRMMTLSWNVTEENLQRNPTTVVYAPARAFFHALSADQVAIVSQDGTGQSFPCTYVDPLQATVITCSAHRTGLHMLLMALRPGIPPSLALEAAL